MNILFIGFKGCGKTFFGEAVAKELGLDFIDIDDVIEDIHAEGISCRQIYKKYGKESFRNMETKALKKLKQVKDSVIALGGGTLDKEENRAIVKSLGRKVYLKRNPKFLFRKIEKEGFPPFFDKKDPRRSFDELYETRTKYYKVSADIIFDGVDKDDLTIKEELVILLR